MPDLKNLKIEPNKQTQAEKKEEENELPQFMSKLELNDEQKERLVEEIFAEWKEIKRQREDERLEEKWDMLQNQYDGVLEDNRDQQFNLHRPTTKIKVDAITKAIMRSLFESDPVFSVSPRPEFAREGGIEVCDHQEDFLDSKMDSSDIPMKPELSLVAKSAPLKGTGFLKLTYDIKTEKKKREEEYIGENIPVIDPRTKQQALNPEGKPVFDNPGLKDFLKKYPDAVEKYPGYVKRLADGKKINIVVSYEETTYNDPLPKFVDLKDFYARTDTNGYVGLCETRLTVERDNYTWWTLKKEEAKGKFFDIDKIMEEMKNGKATGETIEGYKNKDYDILECVYYFKLNDPEDDDEEEIKIQCWIAEDRKVVIGAAYYPYDAVPCYYIPFYVKKGNKGLYQPSVAEDLTDTNIAENAFLNFTLEAAWIANMVTPITHEGSSVDLQFLEKRWAHGIPINVAKGEKVEFLNKQLQKPDTGSLLKIVQYLTQGADDVTGISSAWATGQADPVDPRAPAAKTLRLLNQVDKNMMSYILEFLPSFNLIPGIMLQYYYQMNTEGRRYKPRPERVTGTNPFAVLERSEMIARTNIQSQAHTFDLDRLNEKKEDVALFSLVRQEPLIAQNPQAVYLLLKNIVKRWSPKWKVQVDKLLPSIEQLQKRQIQVAVQAMGIYMKQKLQEAQVTGVKPEFDPREILALMNQMQAEIATPPPEAVQKEREKKAKKLKGE